MTRGQHNNWQKELKNSVFCKMLVFVLWPTFFIYSRFIQFFAQSIASLKLNMLPSFHIKTSKAEWMKNNIKRISRFFQYFKIFTFFESHFPCNIWVQSDRIVQPKTAPETRSGFQCTPKNSDQNLQKWQNWSSSKLEKCKKCNNFLQQISKAKK